MKYANNLFIILLSLTSLTNCSRTRIVKIDGTVFIKNGTPIPNMPVRICYLEYQSKSSSRVCSGHTKTDKDGHYLINSEIPRKACYEIELEPDSAKFDSNSGCPDELHFDIHLK